MQRDTAGNYVVQGSGGDDRVTVTEYSPSSGNSPWGPTKYLKVQVNNDTYLIPLDGPNAAKSVGIYAGAGNDSVFVDPNVTTPLFISGGAGNDFLKGGSGPNALLGGTGNDTLIGGRSDDLLMGGPGFDTISGGGGRDMYSLSDLFNRLREGRCCPPPPKPFPVYTSPQPPVSQPVEPAPLPQPTAPSAPPPVVVAPPLPPPPTPIYSLPKPPVHQHLSPPPPKPQTPPRPPLSSLMSAVDTYDEKGFKSGRDMTKNLLTAAYESPAKLRQVLASISGNKEKDDAVASFARALLDSGPQGAKMLKDLPSDIKETLYKYLDGGNAWSANKKGIDLILAKMTGRPTTRFNDKDTMQSFQRYQGVL